ncbi:MAG TPA: phytoene desaturase family protein [bacterium]|nr:phytoene desaturase family protein [bacterium]
MPKKVIVIGGGLAGLSSALRLAKTGFDVTLFEQNRSLGGKMNERRLNGYRFDTGPSLLTMPFVVDELLQCIGAAPPDALTYTPLEPLCRYRFADKTVFDARLDPMQMEAEVRRVAPDEVSAYHRFLRYSRRIFNHTADLFLWNPIHEMDVAHLPLYMKSLLRLHRIDPLRTVHTAVASHFQDPNLIQLFDRYATYNGSDPYQAPATLNIIPYVEFGLGGFYISGGMYRLVRVLEQQAPSLGVNIYRSSRVEKILQNQGRVTGVRVGGDAHPADYVICNVDVATAYRQLLEGAPRQQRKVAAQEPSLSGLVFFWGKRGVTPGLRHHNIFFSNDYRREFHQLFQELQAPDDPTVYVAISSKTDPGDAPAGRENWFVLVNMPYLNDSQDWPQIVEKTRQQVFRKLTAHGIDIAGKIEMEEILTPQDFYRLYGSNRGSIYGVSSNSRTTAFQRHPNRSRDIRGLYFAGGSVHPGGGIPLVLLSGRMTANLIAGREGIESQNQRDGSSLREITERWHAGLDSIINEKQQGTAHE